MGWSAGFEVVDVDQHFRPSGAQHRDQAREDPIGLLMGIADEEGHRASLAMVISKQLWLSGFEVM